MDRLACADLPALALQLLLARHPGWKMLPTAVVDADEPNGTLLWVNTAAWRSRLRPGLRYAAALALEGRLRAAVVTKTEIDAAVASALALLRLHTPHVEPSNDEPGVFWLDAGGLELLYASVEAWALAVAHTLHEHGFEVRVAAGFTRFGTYALARSMDAGLLRPAQGKRRRGSWPKGRRVLVCESRDEEKRLVGDVVLETLGIDAQLGQALRRFGIFRVAEFAALPVDGLRRRFGEEAALLHRRARGEAWDPLKPLAPEEPLIRSSVLEDPVGDSVVLLRLAGRLLADLLAGLAGRGLAATAATVTLHRSLRDEPPPVVVEVRTAGPTLDRALLVDLVALRFETAAKKELAGAPVVEIAVAVEAATAPRDQLLLFRERRDLGAASRALARVRAEFGDGSVVRAVLREGHLPEAGYAWEPVDKVVPASPRTACARPLVRRIHDRAVALPPPPSSRRNDAWMAPAAAVHEMTGPYVVSGGWWNREVHRDYYYAAADDGELLWMYYDRRRRRWFLAGSVE